MQPSVLEISRKEFESTIERKLDIAIPADFKATAQAAKLGRPLVDAVRGSKASIGIFALAEMIQGSAADVAETPVEEAKAKKSMLGGFKSLMAKK